VAPRPLCLRVDAGRLPASVIDELKRIFEDFPGESEVVLEVHTRTGLRKLRFGDDFKVAGRNAALKAELDRVLGAAVLPPAVPAPA
jgi:DNA polymerase III subunit alpha